MSTDHFIMKCRECKTILAQCRCIGKKEIKWSLCEKCKAKAGAILNSAMGRTDL